MHFNLCFPVICISFGLPPDYCAVKTILSQKSTAFRNRQNVLTRFLQISMRSFINFDVNKRRNILDSILLALFCKEARCTDTLIFFFRNYRYDTQFSELINEERNLNSFINFTLVQLHKHFVYCIIKVLSVLIWVSSFSLFLDWEMLSPA